MGRLAIPTYPSSCLYISRFYFAFSSPSFFLFAPKHPLIQSARNSPLIINSSTKNFKNSLIFFIFSSFCSQYITSPILWQIKIVITDVITINGRYRVYHTSVGYPISGFAFYFSFTPILIKLF